MAPAPSMHAPTTSCAPAVGAVLADRDQPMQASRDCIPSAHMSLESFMDAMQTVVAPILPAPAPRRRRNEVPPNFTPRRSGRIALTDRGLDSEMKAKRILLRRLGLLQEDEPLNDAILARYSALFKQPLAEDVIQAFADFYGWSLPPVQAGVAVMASPCPVEG